MAKINAKQDNLEKLGKLSPAMAADIGDINSRLFMALDELNVNEPDIERVKNLLIASLKKLPYPNQIELHKYC